MAGKRLSYMAAATGLVITDFVMPETEGLEMIVEFKCLYAGAKTIAITGENGLVRAPSYRWRGPWAQQELAKPFSHREFLKAVIGVLQGE